MKKRTVVIISVVALILLGIAGWNIYGWWLKHKLERYKADLVAQGEKLTLRELIADHRVPEFNSADVFNRSTALVRQSGVLRSNAPGAMRMIAPGRAIVGSRQPLLIDKEPWMSKTPVTNTWAELADDLAQSQEGIELVHEIIAHPDLDFHLDYNAGAMLLLPHISALKQSAQVLSAAAMLDLHNGKPASAAKHIRAKLAISKGMRNEPLVISQLVRIAILTISLGPTWELLQSPDVSEADLKLIQSDFAEQDFIVPMQHAFEMERAMGSSTIHHYREQGGIYDMFGSSGGGAPSTNFADLMEERAKRSFSPESIRKTSNELLWQSALSYEDELLHLQGITALIEELRAGATNKPLAEVCSNAFLRVKADGKGDDDDVFWNQSNGGDELSLKTLRQMFSATGRSVWRSVTKVRTIETGRVLVISAIAIKRYQLPSGNLPKTLDALVPEFLPAPPRDPVDGKPLRYHPNPDGRYLLYSVGENGIDDGGDASPATVDSKARLSILRGRDMVWPQPATPDEIPAQNP